MGTQISTNGSKLEDAATTAPIHVPFKKRNGSGGSVRHAGGVGGFTISNRRLLGAASCSPLADGRARDGDLPPRGIGDIDDKRETRARSNLRGRYKTSYNDLHKKLEDLTPFPPSPHLADARGPVGRRRAVANKDPAVETRTTTPHHEPTLGCPLCLHSPALRQWCVYVRISTTHQGLPPQQ